LLFRLRSRASGSRAKVADIVQTAWGEGGFELVDGQAVVVFLGLFSFMVWVAGM
jgi:hypothetical protein